MAFSQPWNFLFHGGSLGPVLSGQVSTLVSAIQSAMETTESDDESSGDGDGKEPHSKCFHASDTI